MCGTCRIYACICKFILEMQATNTYIPHSRIPLCPGLLNERNPFLSSLDEAALSLTSAACNICTDMVSLGVLSHSNAMHLLTMITGDTATNKKNYTITPQMLLRVNKRFLSSRFQSIPVSVFHQDFLSWRHTSELLLRSLSEHLGCDTQLCPLLRSG